MRTEPNIDGYITREPEPAEVVGYCGDCCHEIQEGDKVECYCGEIRCSKCLFVCRTRDCTIVGCSTCFTHTDEDGDRICEDCHNKLIEERKNFVSNVGVLVATALTGLDYDVSRPFRQELDDKTVLEFRCPGRPIITMGIGKEDLE